MAKYENKKPKTHKIKLDIGFADAVLSGDKCFEVRINDRGYQKGDLVRFKVVDGGCSVAWHDLNDVVFEITYVLAGWGISPNYVAFGIRRVENG